MQSIYLPLTARVHRYGPSVDVPALRSRSVREGVHRQANELEQVFRVRVVREPILRTIGHIRDERIPDRHQEVKGAAEEAEGGEPPLLNATEPPPSTACQCLGGQPPEVPPSTSQDQVAAIYTNCEIFLLVNRGECRL